MKITILAALKEEINSFRKTQEMRIVKNASPFIEYQFQFSKIDVSLMLTGVGKVSAAMVAQYAVNHTNPNYLIVTGIAGGLQPGLALGDVVVSKDCLQHDLDLTHMGFKIGQIPFTEHRILVADPKLVELALATTIEGQRIVPGRILTGDQLIVAPNAEENKRLSFLQGDVVEMEGAAIALVATTNGIPFVIIRSVSDCVSTKSPTNFGPLIRQAAANSCAVCYGVLSGLNKLCHHKVEPITMIKNRDE